jgi:hypothetical protein
VLRVIERATGLLLTLAPPPAATTVRRPIDDPPAAPGPAGQIRPPVAIPVARAPARAISVPWGEPDEGLPLVSVATWAWPESWPLPPRRGSVAPPAIPVPVGGNATSGPGSAGVSTGAIPVSTFATSDRSAAPERPPAWLTAGAGAVSRRSGSTRAPRRRQHERRRGTATRVALLVLGFVVSLIAAEVVGRAARR